MAEKQIFTKLVNDSTKVQLNNTWKGLQPTKTTLNKRSVMKAGMDNFATFSWRGIKSWEIFGAFIIAEKPGDLRFYNGSGFSNEYTNPMFDSHKGHLVGVSFQQQKIQFKIGMYWFNTEEYRKFLNWLDPYTVDYLTFDFDTEYSYLVKLSSISDSPKYIVGKETFYVNDEPKEVIEYYTELTLNWDVQGDPIARATLADQWTYNEGLNGYITSKASDLDRPLVIDFNYEPNLDLDTNAVECLASYTINNSTITTTLFKIIFNSSALVESGNQEEFQNNNNESLSEVTNIDETDINSNISDYIIHLRYDSETGLLFKSDLNETWNLLSLATATTKGINLVSSIISNKFYIPGSLESEDFNIENFKIIINSTEVTSATITSYARTNIA